MYINRFVLWNFSFFPPPIKNVSFIQVKELKEKIESERGKDAFPVAGQKLIYAGNGYSEDTVYEFMLFFMLLLDFDVNIKSSKDCKYWNANRLKNKKAPEKETNNKSVVKGNS